jgi:hypothetical protein
MEESLWLSCKTSDFRGRHCLSKEVAGEYILSVYKVVTTKLYILASCYNILNNLTVNSKEQGRDGGYGHHTHVARMFDLGPVYFNL